MMLGGTPFLQNNNPQGFQVYEGVENSTLSSSACPTPGAGIHSQTLWYNLSVLRDKVQQVQSLVSLVVSPDPSQQESIAASGAAAIIQEIIVAASSMMYALQHAAAAGDISHPHDMKASYECSAQPNGPDHIDRVLNELKGGRMGIFGSSAHYSTDSVIPIASSAEVGNGHGNEDNSKKPGSPSSNVIELDVADLLAKYTHYCQVCGKGFKRVANLRMHTRAHGDEYKRVATLCNPMKGSRGSTMGQKDDPLFGLPRKYSCPLEGCRWNKNHAKFQPLKSVICVKNHYKRSHCPKMYVCNRCNQKKFSVLSDLRTHEKHCGDLKWMCSCGTTFSRKDKLMGHVALFVGHRPI